MEAGQIALVAVSIVALVVVASAIALAFYLAQQLSSSHERERKAGGEGTELRLQVAALTRSVDDRDKAIEALKENVEAEQKARGVCQKQYDELLTTIAKTGSAKDVVTSINEELQKLGKSSAEPEPKPTSDRKPSP